jgi:hypothetical protein
MLTLVTRAAVTAAIGLASFAASANADFTLTNRTGFDLREIYVSPANKNTWGRDRLGRNLLENGRSRKFVFADTSACVQDLKVVFDDDGSEAIWEDLNLCELDKITLKYNRRTREVTAETE